MDEKETNISPDEQIAEQEALQESKVDEIRESVISEYDFDEEDDAERIDKLVEKEVSNRKKLSEAIGQKIKYRDLAKANDDPKPKEKAGKKVEDDSEDIDSKLDKKLNESLDKRDLDSLDYPDELKTEIKRISKATGVSIKEALQDSYIVHKVEEHENKSKEDNASISRTNKSVGKKSWSFENPPEVNVRTEEGRKVWEEYKEEMKKQGH